MGHIRDTIRFNLIDPILKLLATQEKQIIEQNIDNFLTILRNDDKLLYKGKKNKKIINTAIK